MQQTCAQVSGVDEILPLERLVEDAIAMNLRASEDKRITIGELVRIAIADNGIGISPENLDRIFGHGFTTRKDGHGFGLHSSALAAKEMGGTLAATSAGLGRGSSFSIELPVAPRPTNT